MNNLKRYEEITRKKFIGNDYSIEQFQNSKAVSNLIKEIDKLKKENKNLKDNKNEALRYISNYLALDQRHKWNDNVDEKLKLVKKILNGREKTITNISYEILLRQNKQLQNNRDKAIEINKYIYDNLENMDFGEVKCKINRVSDILKGDSDE